jgi:hypothetical protein
MTLLTQAGQQGVRAGLPHEKEPERNRKATTKRQMASYDDQKARASKTISLSHSLAQIRAEKLCEPSAQVC